MKQPKISDLRINRKTTTAVRKQMAASKGVKITINIDADSLDHLRSSAKETGVPYQRILNQVLRDGISKRASAESRLTRIERDLASLRRQIVA